jgi:hypothetical protein
LNSEAHSCFGKVARTFTVSFDIPSAHNELAEARATRALPQVALSPVSSRHVPFSSFEASGAIVAHLTDQFTRSPVREGDPVDGNRLVDGRKGVVRDDKESDPNTISEIWV